MYLRARGRRVGCAQRSKLRFALRARENEEVDIEFLRISCACIRSLPGAQASSRNSGRCTSFSLNLHTSLMRHPPRLPRPTVVEALRMDNPRCSKGALALAPRHDFSWVGNPCFCFSSVLKAEKWFSTGIHYGAQGKPVILRKRGRGLKRRAKRHGEARLGGYLAARPRRPCYIDLPP